MPEPTYQIPLDRTANEPIAAGIHPFTILSFTEGEGKAGPYWAFDCQCNTPSEEGKTARLFLSLTPQSRWKMEIFLDAVGAPKAGAATADKFVGRKFRGNIELGEYEGRPQAKITDMFPMVSSAAPTKVSAAAVTTKVVTKAVETSAPAKAKVAAKKAALPADATGDEIPF